MYSNAPAATCFTITGGQFLQEKLSLDQLSVDLYNGKGRITDVWLDVKGLNELGEKFNLPVRFVEGFITSIEVAIPWSKPLTDNSVVEVDGLMLTVQPKERIDDASMFEPMWGSMMSSMQLAEEYLKQEPLDAEKEAPAAAEAFTGLEQFAQAIETVFCRIKVRLTNTVIRVEHLPNWPSKQGIALELRIANMDYFDEESAEVGEIAGERIAQRVRERFSVSTKRIILNGTSLYTDEFVLEKDTAEVPTKLSAENDEPQEMLMSCAGASPPLAPPHQEAPPEPTIEPIPICRLSGQQEIRIQLKQDESLEGSGVDMEFSLGQLAFFLRPRQVHLLLQLAKGFSTPTSANDNLSGGLKGRQNKCTPMEPHHYTIVEQDLQQQLLNQKPRPSRSLGMNMGWSTSSSACLSETEDEYVPMTNQRAFYESGSLASSDMESSVTSSTHSAYSKPRKRSKGKRRSSQGYLEDILMESTHFRVHCSAVCIVILHDDVAGVAETFFRALAGQNLRDLKAVHSLLPKICRSDHLWINGTPVTLEGTERSSSSQWSLNFQLSVVEMEVAECLFNRRSNVEGESASLQDADITDILAFYETDDKKKKPSEAEPFLRLKYEYPKKSAQNRTGREQTTGISVELLPVQIEVDRSLEDRIHALLYPPPQFSSTNEKKNDIWSMSVNQDNQGSSHVPERTSVTVRSPFIKANLRFPIPDVRPIHEVLREAWWEKNLRPDILSVELSEPTLSTTFVADDNEDLKFVLVCKEANLFYKESQLAKPVPFGRVFRDPTVKEEGFDLPSLEISISPSNEPSPLETELCEESMMPSVIRTRSAHPARRGYKSRGAQEGAKSDKMVQPSDKATLRTFIDKTASNCRIQLEFLLPSVELTMPDKQFYEIIYNRLTMDLVLWEPVVSRLVASGDCSIIASSGDGASFYPDIRAPGQLAQQSSMFQEFHMCRSGNMLESDNESDDAPLMFHSVYDNQRRSTMIRPDRSHLQARVASCQSWQTQLVINVHITNGTATLRTPLRDSDGKVMSKYHGHLRVSVKDAQLFVSSSHRGDPDVNYVVFNAGTASLQHQGKVCSVWDRATPLPVLYKSGDGVTSVKMPSFMGSEPEVADMLSLVIETHADQLQGVKTIKVAVGVSDTTLRHRMTPLRCSWVKQFVDFFDVTDEEVLGYQPLGVVTEFHLTLSNCAIDYRPLSLPYQTLVSMESFSISSNITANTTTSQLRIIAEEVFLYISDKVSKDDPPDLSDGYICVADTDLFDISARTTDVPGQRASTIKMKASNNITNLRTPPPEPSSYGGRGGGSGTVLVEHLSSVTGTMADHLQSLVASAMHESCSSSSSSEEGDEDSDDSFQDARGGNKYGHYTENVRYKRHVVDVRLEAHENEVDGTTSSQSRAESHISSAVDSSYSDEEFCILEDYPGVGIMPRSGEPQIRMLVTEPIEVRENYFSSAARNTDQLRAPRNFPEAIQKYTLREMTLVWYMYGGCDFESSITPNAPRPPEKSTGQWNDGTEECYANVVLEPVVGNASYSRDGLSAVEMLPFKPQSPPQTPRHRRAHKGGPGRREDVLMELHMNKIRFQHEVYPEDTYYASRQVLLIQDVEVRDRLASSRINKFLYQYASEAKPRQSHANMVSVKCVRVRPDLKAPSAEECQIRVSVKPVKINADQDAVLFLVQFFTGLCSEPPTSPSSPRPDSPEFSTLKAGPAVAASGQASAEPGRHVAFAADDTCPPERISPAGSTSNSTPMPLYIRSFVFTPDVPIRIDYHGKRGALAGLLMGLGQLNCLEITLKKLQMRQGLLGFDKLLAFALNEWLNDIKKNQVPSVLGGVGPMHSFVQLFSGLRDLVWMPVEQYRRDGRIVRGLQRGANSFTISTAMACLELTNKLVQTVQGVAELAYDMLSPGPSMHIEAQNRRHRAVPNNLPVDIRDGVNNAYQVVAEGLGDTARTLLPPTMAAGIIVATEATSTVLGGVRNQIQPDARREDIQKWRQRLPPKSTGATSAASASALAAASR
ncbi:hypothetical protein MTO96_011200 [Rhipicephalus appendiculatus]